MKFLIQRVAHASVDVDGRTVGSIQRGYLVLIGVCDKDTRETADQYVRKLLSLRIFEDDQGKTNRSLADVDGGLLLVSQFTLYANCKKGNRPSFVDAGSPAHAEALYNYIVEKCRERVPVVQTGAFGEEMAVELLNDGPFTIILDSEKL